MKARVIVMDFGSRTNTFGGEARMASVLYGGLKAHFSTTYLGYRTEYINANDDTIILKHIKKFAHNPGVKNSGLAENWFMRLGYFSLMGRNLIDIGIKKDALADRIKSFSPDIIISNSTWDFSTIRYLRKRMNFKTIYIDHANISGSSAKNYFSKAIMPLTLGTGLVGLDIDSIKSKFFKYFDATVALNKSQARKMLKFTDRAYYIPNGLHVDTTSDSGIEDVIRKRYGVSKSDFVVMYIGRMFERQKNVSTLIKAFVHLQNNNIKLLLIGGGQSMADYKRLASGDKRIIFCGEVDDERLPYIYNLASIFVLPSVWEGFNLTILEAANHRLPLVVSEGAYIDDLKVVKLGKIITFRTFDHNDLARKILFLMNSVKAMNEARKVSERLAGMFTQEAMLKKYSNLIEDLVK